MADTDEKVYAAVEAELKKNPDASVDELYEMAKGINKSVGSLTKRQFHARYPLQVKRKAGRKSKAAAKKGQKSKGGAKKGRKSTGRKAAAKKSTSSGSGAKKGRKKASSRTTGARKGRRSTGTGRGRKKAAATPREAVRNEFMSFAQELSAAEARKDAIRVLADVDAYVDRVLGATGAD